MTERKPDLQSEADIKTLVDAFYLKIRADAVVGPIFTDVARVDWEHHLPRMYAFWNQMLLGKPGYAGAPLASHLPLPVDMSHFDRWLALFRAAVDENFEGPMALRAKNTAASIAHTFALRLGVM